MSLREFGWHEALFLLLAARWAVLLAVVAFAGGGLIGLLIAALRVGPSVPLRRAAAAYVAFMQSTPILIQLFAVYYGSAFVGLRPDPWPAAALTFCLNAGAFFGEIFRGAIEAVPSGQWEAARALGLRHAATLRLVVLPQAARLSLPPTVGFMVQIVKATSVASLIGLTELSRTATMINTVTFQPVLVFGTVAAIYFALCWPLSLLGRHLEGRLGLGRERRVAL
ncbi:amino acid ABC transporter permease [Labrys wisconsinensis]|uniref:Polar amino acid transport system permease protein n=1 Tax=Labrys wisconsinensis TaxID=425677 RepID=A0ABU0JI72_9HYPH|nr:amino acid ABC transporter permease [Labrys wisconsinensis]MDQ0473982.1 polar amino acid transport system permease protein [Labrys wisconsinensis]